jgi:hypothetical protein
MISPDPENRNASALRLDPARSDFQARQAGGPAEKIMLHHTLAYHCSGDARGRRDPPIVKPC